jgi:15-cis-phytoene synthase
MTAAIAPPDPSLRTEFAAARAICRRQGGWLYLPSFFLPPAKRDACYTTYAFCRMIDQAIDVDANASQGASACSPGDLDARVNLFRARLDEIYAGQLDLPPIEQRLELDHVLHAMTQVVRQYEIPQRHFLDVADARRAELTVARYPTWSRLEKYCRQRAGSLGSIACAILGVQSSSAAEYGNQLCTGMRLTTILRDIKHDHADGRIYLPLEDMARFGYSQRDLAAGVVNDPFRELMKFEIARARDLYRQGSEGICWLADDGSRMFAASLAILCAEILRVIERRDLDVFSSPPIVSLGGRVVLLRSAWSLAKRSAGEALPVVF